MVFGFIDVKTGVLRLYAASLNVCKCEWYLPVFLFWDASQSMVTDYFHSVEKNNKDIFQNEI